MTHSSTPSTSQVAPSSEESPDDLSSDLAGDPSALAPSDDQPNIRFRSTHFSVWRRLYAWTWITTLSIIGLTFLGFKLLPPHSFSENFTDGRPQVSVRVDRILAILRGQLIIDSDEEVISMIPSLLEPTEVYGLLPVLSADGNRAWRAYRSREPVTAGRGKIVVIVSGLGLDRRVTERAIDMPAAVTLEFSPYGRSLSRWALFARDRGHELLLSLPVEGLPESGIDAGNLQLTVKQGVAENMHRLKSVLGRMTGYVGISTGHKSPFLQDQEALSPILRDVATRGLLFLDVGLLDSKSLSQALRYSPNRGSATRMPLAKLDLSLDSAQTREEIELALEKVTSSTRGKSAATIVRFAPLPVTLEVLDQWLILLGSSSKHQVIPLSAIFSENSGKQRRF